MMMKDLPQQPDQESLTQLSKEELVSIIIEQATLLREQQKVILKTRQKIQRLKVNRDLNSQTSSKPRMISLTKLNYPEYENQS